MSDIELKPCPFCGSDNVKILPYVDGFTKNGIRCLNCECVTTFEDCKLVYDRLIELWNKRAERHGVWNIDYDDIVCSECGTVFNLNDNDTENFNFCPNCGSKMEEEK